MNKPTLIILTITLLLISGCSGTMNSYDSCLDDCKALNCDKIVNSDDNIYLWRDCYYRNFEEECYNECKPK